MSLLRGYNRRVIYTTANGKSMFLYIGKKLFYFKMNCDRVEHLHIETLSAERISFNTCKIIIIELLLSRHLCTSTWRIIPTLCCLLCTRLYTPLEIDAIEKVFILGYSDIQLHCPLKRKALRREDNGSIFFCLS
jgi:hypothetical protein